MVIIEQLVFLAPGRSIMYMVSGLVVLAHYYFELFQNPVLGGN